MRTIVYVDMDDVLVDFKTGIEKLSHADLELYKGRYDEAPHIFSKMEPKENAIESYIKLCSKYDTYILSTSPWENPTALNDKLDWVKKHLGHHAHKRLILTKNLFQRGSGSKSNSILPEKGIIRDRMRSHAISCDRMKSHAIACDRMGSHAIA